jgi:preprotein translocase subunit SecA
MDMLWVEHLEVMGYTRSSVTLRAYGQRDPLIEYRKEGKRLFKEMQDALLHRLNNVLPKVQPKLVEQEEIDRKREAEAAQAAAGETAKPKKVTNQTPVVKETTHGRNDLVTITKGEETKELKYKKAEAYLKEGWQIK